MRISPVTNFNINNRNTSFKSASMPAREAENFLRNPSLINESHFKDGIIHTGLAKLNYYYPENAQNLKKLYRYVISTLRIESPQRRPDIAIREGLRNNNAEYLRILIDEMGVIPMDPKGEVPVDILIMGKESPDRNIRNLFDDEYLRRKTSVLGWGAWDDNRKPYEIIEGVDIFREMFEEFNRGTVTDLYSGIYPDFFEGDWNTPENRNALEELFNKTEKSNASSLLANTNIQQETLDSAKKIIEQDEENYGLVTINSIMKIVNDPNFRTIKDISLNISGSKILHLLAEIYINQNDKTEMKMLDYIIKSCELADYNFDITNDFGETALDKAMEANSVPLIEVLRPRCRDCGYKSNGWKD